MKKIIKNMDKKLFIATLILFSFGLIMIFSASNITAYMYGASVSRYFMKQLFFLLISFSFCAFLLVRIPTSKYKKLSWIALAGVIGLVMVALVYGAVVNDTSGWLGIGFLGIQPSELAKVVIIVWLACYYGNNKNKNIYDNDIKLYFPLLVVAFITLLIVLQNDYGTAFIFLLISLFIFFMSPTPKKTKLFVLLSGLIFTILVIILSVTGAVKILTEDKLARFNFTNPCSRFLTDGNQVCNSYIAINSGGILGKGLGNSTQKYLHLPEAHTDFIFAIVVEELGLVGALILILFYLFVLARIIFIGKRAITNANALICYGVAFYIFLHIVVNLGGVMGLIPITGIPLAFISYGGSFALSMMCALTVVQRINIENNLAKN